MKKPIYRATDSDGGIVVEGTPAEVAAVVCGPTWVKGEPVDRLVGTVLKIMVDLGDGRGFEELEDVEVKGGPPKHWPAQPVEGSVNPPLVPQTPKEIAHLQWRYALTDEAQAAQNAYSRKIGREVL